ncbi:MAG: DNA polymerase III subunit delta' [Candidatus Xenobia bacterium]
MATAAPTLPRTLLLNPPDLAERLVSGQFPAVILAGPEGSGKMTLAMWWACSANCETRCGTCRTCRLLLGNRHPDLHLLAPAEDATGLKIEQVREMQERLRYRPLEAKTRFIILDRAETLSEGAANALLKTLEEPPPQTVLVLLANHQAALLPTVRSRCRLFKLLPVDVTTVSQWLQEEGADALHAALAARLAEGAPGRARAMLGDTAWWSFREDALELYREVLDGITPLRAAEAADELSRLGRDRLMRHLELGATWLRDCLMVAQGQQDLLNLDRAEVLHRQGVARPAASWADAITKLAGARRQLKLNANVKLQLQLMLQQLTQP